MAISHSSGRALVAGTDILVVRALRAHLFMRHYLESPADLVVEIASESDPGLDYQEKLTHNEKAGGDSSCSSIPLRSRCS